MIPVSVLRLNTHNRPEIHWLPWFSHISVSWIFSSDRGFTANICTSSCPPPHRSRPKHGIRFLQHYPSFLQRLVSRVLTCRPRSCPSSSSRNAIFKWVLGGAEISGGDFFSETVGYLEPLKWVFLESLLWCLLSGDGDKRWFQVFSRCRRFHKARRHHNISLRRPFCLVPCQWTQSD